MSNAYILLYCSVALLLYYYKHIPYDIRCVTSLSLFKRKLYVHFKSL